MYLVDTNILSAGAPTKSAADRALVSAWLERRGDALFLSAITIAEIEAGIAKAQRSGATAMSDALRQWLGVVEHLYGDRILPFGIEEAHCAGAMMDKARARAPGFEDIAIAATAEAHGLTVLTANLRHFEPLGVPCIDPFAELPD